MVCRIWGRLAVPGDICAKCGTIHCGVTKLTPFEWKHIWLWQGSGQVAQRGSPSRFGTRKNSDHFSTNDSGTARVGCIMRDFPILLAWGRALASFCKHDEHVNFRVSQQHVRRALDATSNASDALAIEMAAFPAPTSILEPPPSPDAPRYHSMDQ